MLFATGLDPDRSTVFVQSHVTAHPEAAWLLSSVTSFGELRRMTQFKDRAAEQDFVSAGLFTYPVLMAGDILLYQADLVPVGDDQRQHVELTRDIAERFNQRFGETFVVPEVSIPEDGARIKNLQEPERLMSTTRGAPQGVVRLVDPPETIRKKFKTAVTDSGSEVRHDPAEKAGISNLIEIMAVATGDSIPAIESRYDGQGYGQFKQDVAEAVVELLTPIQQRYEELRADEPQLRAHARPRRREGPRGLGAHARADVRADGIRPALERPRPLRGGAAKPSIFVALVCVEDVREAVHRRVARAERREAVALLDRREHRGRVVLGVVDDERALEVRAEHERRDARPGAPLVVRAVVVALARRRHVIPLAAELVVGDEHERVLLALAVLDRLQQIDEVVAAVRLARVARMLVLLADRLDEADRLQVAVALRAVAAWMNSCSSRRCAARFASPEAVSVEKLA